MNLTTSIEKKWYAVYTKSHFERKVNTILAKKEITTFLPLRKGKARMGTSFRFTKIPLFRSYLFTYIAPYSEEYFNVLGTTGVSTIVKQGKKPCPVPSFTIESLKKLIKTMNDSYSVITGIKRGEKVIIVNGALNGCVGEMVKIDNKKCAFIVNVDILGRAVKVLIPPGYVSKL